MKEIVERPSDELDAVWKALSDPTRRAILDYLRDRPRTTTEIVETFPHLTRFGVMKHLDVLRQAHLVSTREEGRQRVNSLNVVPIRQIYERWVGPFQELWTGELLRIKEIAEGETCETRTRKSRKPTHVTARAEHRRAKRGNTRTRSEI